MNYLDAINSKNTEKYVNDYCKYLIKVPNENNKKGVENNGNTIIPANDKI